MATEPQYVEFNYFCCICLNARRAVPFPIDEKEPKILSKNTFAFFQFNQLARLTDFWRARTRFAFKAAFEKKR